jgi:hypothetical protein
MLGTKKGGNHAIEKETSQKNRKKGASQKT